MKTIAVQKSQAPSNEVPVNVGALLEDNLRKVKGKHYHVQGIAEYIANSDDSYRRQAKYHNQLITVELISYHKRGRYLDKVIIRDLAEGMSYEGLENNFFVYFESHSGRSEGQKVTGKFGTGGKAYAIMNFDECWITSVQDGKECKAWFKWDATKKIIRKGYDNGGYIDKNVNRPNGTVVELLKSDNYYHLIDLIIKLNELPRVRHVIKNQRVEVTISQGKGRTSPQTFPLVYDPPKNHIDEWKFPLPDLLKIDDSDRHELILKYFDKPPKYQAIDVQDGISSIVDLPINTFDERPWAKYLSGEVVIEKLADSTAVKENRKGLEEGNDLTVEINDFLTESIRSVVSEIQERQRQKEKERNIEVSSKKITELNKFLRKCEMNFSRSLNELRRSKRSEGVLNDDIDGLNGNETFRRPDENDKEEDIFSGRWDEVQLPSEGGIPGPPGPPNPDPPIHTPSEIFVLNDDGTEGGVREGSLSESGIEQTKKKRGLRVLMTDEPDSPVPSSEYGPYELPVIDKYLKPNGIILINVNNPIIEKSRARKDLEHIFTERVANFVLLVVAQHQTEREMKFRVEEEQNNPLQVLQVFRQKFFELQNDLRTDREISYFDEETESAEDSIE